MRRAASSAFPTTGAGDQREVKLGIEFHRGGTFLEGFLFLELALSLRRVYGAFPVFCHCSCDQVNDRKEPATVAERLHEGTLPKQNSRRTSEMAILHDVNRQRGASSRREGMSAAKLLCQQSTTDMLPTRSRRCSFVGACESQAPATPKEEHGPAT